MDPESQLDAVRNVGVKDGRITAVAEELLAGKETLDTEGHVVAPGFIAVSRLARAAPQGNALSN